MSVVNTEKMEEEEVIEKKPEKEVEDSELQELNDIDREQLNNFIDVILSTEFEGDYTDIDDILKLVIVMMKEIEKYKTIKGVKKKKYVLYAINVLITKKVSNADDKKRILFITNRTLPFIIDTMVSIDKRQIKIKLKSLKKKICKIWKSMVIGCSCCKT